MSADARSVTASDEARYRVFGCNESYDAPTTASATSSDHQNSLAHLLMTSLVLGAIILATIVFII